MPGIPTLGQAVLELSTDSTKFDAGLSSAEKRAERMGSVLQLAIAGAGVAAFGLATKSAIDFESAFTSVRKTVTASEPEFAALESGIRQMAKDIPQSAAGLAELASVAGQLGIKNENLLSFTRTMADLGVATNLTGEKAATMLARFANVTNMDQGKFSNLGSAVVQLGNNFATTEDDIVQFTVRIAGAGEIAGLTEADILGIAAAMSSVGVEAEAGGTAVQKVLLSLTEAVATSNEKLEIFAQTAGLTATEFAKLWKEDASAAFVAFVEGLGKAGQDAFFILDELDFKDQRLIRSFLSMAGAGGLLGEAVTMSNQAFEENIALTREAERRYETTASQLTILKNNLTDVGITVGNAITPVLVESSQALSSLFNAFGKLPDSTQQLIFLGATAAAVGPKFVSMAASAKTALDGIGKSADGARLPMSGWVLAITAAVVAMDMLLQKTTGHGLIGWLSGTAVEMERAAKATREWDAALLAAGKEVDVEALAIKRLLEESKRLTDGFKDMENNIKDVEGRTVSYWAILDGPELGLAKERVKLLADELVKAKTPVVELNDIYKQLNPELQKTFDEVTGVTAAWALYVATIDQTPEQLRALHDEERKQIAVLQETLGPIGHFTQAMRDMSGVLEMAANIAGKPFDEIIAKVPETIRTTDDLAKFLKEDYGEVADALDELLKSVDDTFDGIAESYESIVPDSEATFEEWKAGIDKMIANHQELETNLITIWGHIKDSGVAAPEAMLLAIATKGPEYASNFAKYFADDPEAALTTLESGAAFVTGTTIEGMINKIVEKAPEYSLGVSSLLIKPWQEQEESARQAAAAVAIAQHEALITGIQDPTQIARAVSAASQIGAQIAAGLAGGIRSQEAVSLVSSAAGYLIDQTLAAMAAGAIIKSPSELFASEIGEPITEGVGLGMLRVAPQLLDLSARIIVGVGAVMNRELAIVTNNVNNTLATLAKRISDSPFLDQNGNILPNYVLENSPYLKGLLQDPSALIKDGGLPGGINWIFDPTKGGWTVGAPPVEEHGPFDMYDPIRGGWQSPNQPNERLSSLINVNNYGPVYTDNPDETLNSLGQNVQNELAKHGVY